MDHPQPCLETKEIWVNRVQMVEMDVMDCLECQDAMEKWETRAKTRKMGRKENLENPSPSVIVHILWGAQDYRDSLANLESKENKGNQASTWMTLATANGRIQLRSLGRGRGALVVKRDQLQKMDILV